MKWGKVLARLPFDVQSEESDVDAMKAMFPPENIENITVDWFELGTGKAFSLEPLPGSIVANTEARAIRFRIRIDAHTEELEFEMLVRQTSEGFVLKADCWEGPETEYPLDIASRKNGVLLFCQDECDRIYISVICAGDSGRNND